MNNRKQNERNGHYPERITNRVDKMSGWTGTIKYWIGKSKKFFKRMSSKKRRQFLKNEIKENNYDKY